MPLIGASIPLGFIKTNRVLHISGRYGGGKTSVAFRLARELLESGFSRYLVSNVESVWNDRFEDVKLLYNGKVSTADVVVILDEGGLFLKTGHDVDEFLAFLRKLNIVLLIPSYQPPSTRVRALTMQRTFNAEIIGIPAWQYTVSLNMGQINEKASFWWRNPSEIYGIYNTQGFPADDMGLGEYMRKWTNEASKRAGYGEAKKSNSPLRFVGFENAPAASGAVSDQIQAVENFGRVADALNEGAEAIAQSLSLLEQSNKKGRNKR